VVPIEKEMHKKTALKPMAFTRQRSVGGKRIGQGEGEKEEEERERKGEIRSYQNITRTEEIKNKEHLRPTKTS